MDQTISGFENRKRDHLRLALDPAHQSAGDLDAYQLIHEALPEVDFEQVDLTSECLGSEILTPFFVAAMTAGHAQAPRLNELWARAAASRGWAMGVGSQRRQLDAAFEQAGDWDQWKTLRREVPRLKLLANVGLSQLKHAPIDRLRAIVDSLEASALVVHANALQEALQPEGTPQFAGAEAALGRVCREIGVPVILKETGCGFSAETLGRLRHLGLAAIDVSGRGGTHWGRIEGARAAESSAVSEAGLLRAQAAETFANWGQTTAQSVIAAHEVLPFGIRIWASGGVRSGLDAAKLIALGAHQVGYAKPALEAALQGEDALQLWMKRQELELKIALFCTGCATPAKLRANSAKVEQKIARAGAPSA